MVSYKRGQLTAEVVERLAKRHKMITYPGMGHEGTLVSRDQRMLIIITHSPFTGGVGGYQAVYLGRNELTQSTCQNLVFVVTSSTFFFQRCLLQ